MLGVLYAIFLIQSVLYTFLLTETLATFVGISVLGGILWPRANRWGALASIIAALATNFFLYSLTGQRLDYWDANVFLAALAAGIVALVVVSLMTPPEPAAATAVLRSARTSSDGDDFRTGASQVSPLAAAPVGRPVAVVSRTRQDAPLLLVNLLRLRQGAQGRGWRAYREDLFGFALGWTIVIVLVAITALLLAM